MFLIKLFKLIKAEFELYMFNIVSSFPDSFVGNNLRKIYWKKQLYKCGISPEFRRRGDFGCPELISIGNHFFISNDCTITAIHSNGIYIGNYVAIGRRSSIHGANHNYDNINKPTVLQGTSCADVYLDKKKYSVIIKDNVLIGTNVIILSGSIINEGCIISSGSVISGEIPSFSVVVGNPGRVVKKRQ